jgi:hypothetical protein
MQLSLAFKGGGGSTFGFQRGEGVPIFNDFQRGSPLSKSVTYLRWPVLTGGRGGGGGSDYCIILYSFSKCLENYEYKVDYDPWVGLIFVNLIIFLYGPSLVCIVLYLYFSAFKPRFLKVLQCSRCVRTIHRCKIYSVHVCEILFKISLL